jgi:hypothetical protein
MLNKRLGMTDIYGLVHSPGCSDPEIVTLRDLHRAIDYAVILAYGWPDMSEAGLDHGFHETRQGRRYTIGTAVRQAILDQLLALNHERYTAEVAAGLHVGRGRRRAVRDSGATPLF